MTVVLEHTILYFGRILVYLEQKIMQNVKWNGVCMDFVPINWQRLKYAQ